MRRLMVFLLVFLLCSQTALAVEEPTPEQEPPALLSTDPRQQLLADGLHALTPDLGNEPVYLAEPSTKAPYSMGALSPAYLRTGLDYVNYVRALAGLAPVTLSELLCIRAQYGAVVLAAGDTLTHTPDKPADMEASFFRLGANTCAAANLSMRFLYQHDILLQSALRGHLDEDSALNRLDLGHRRWLLDPRMGQIGFGLATAQSGKHYITAPISDTSGTGPRPEAVFWPAAGQFPNSLFTPGTPWSVSLDPAVYALPDETALQVRVTRLSDGAVFSPTVLDNRETLDSNGTYLLVSGKQYGLGPCISFSIGREDLQREAYLGDYLVEIYGLYSTEGLETHLTYTVRFFDPENLSAPASWAAEEVTQAALLELVPDSLMDLYGQSITRLEFCRLAMQTLRQATGLTNMELIARYARPDQWVHFTDCHDQDVLTAAAIGAVRGVGNDLFRPEKSITRQDAAVLLLQTAQAVGIVPQEALPLPFADGDLIRDYARQAVAWACSVTDLVTGTPVMAGVGPEEFSPLGTYTREQAILTLLRLYRSGLVVSEAPDFAEEPVLPEE